MEHCLSTKMCVLNYYSFPRSGVPNHSIVSHLIVLKIRIECVNMKFVHQFYQKFANFQTDLKTFTSLRGVIQLFKIAKEGENNKKKINLFFLLKNPKIYLKKHRVIK